MTVLVAQPYNSKRLNSLGDAKEMLISQYRFPYHYDVERDVLMAQYHDRLGLDHAEACFEKYTDSSDQGFGNWVRQATHRQVMDCLKALLNASPSIKWTGYRILGSVHRGNGGLLWYLELFAKHPMSKAKVYSTENAPNVGPVQIGDDEELLR